MRNLNWSVESLGSHCRTAKSQSKLISPRLELSRSVCLQFYSTYLKGTILFKLCSIRTFWLDVIKIKYSTSNAQDFVNHPGALTLVKTMKIVRQLNLFNSSCCCSFLVIEQDTKAYFRNESWKKIRLLMDSLKGSLRWIGILGFAVLILWVPNDEILRQTLSFLNICSGYSVSK